MCFIFQEWPAKHAGTIFLTSRLGSCITSIMPLLRKIFFYIFVLIYLIICPVIILRMLGFVMDPQAHHWVKTGIIYVSSNPPEAKVLINGRPAPETTPAIIRDLPPGEYTIRMELDGYEPWENKIPVVDKKATSVENILLIPKQWRIKALNTLPLTKLIPMPGNNYLLLSSSGIIKDLFILRLDKDIEDQPDTDIHGNPSDLELLFPEESIYRDARVIRYFTVEHSPFFVINIEFSDRHKYLWIDPRDKQVHIEDISDLMPEAPQKLYWEANDEKNIFAFYTGYVNRINIKAKAIYPNIPEKDVPIKKESVDLPIVPQAQQAFWVNNGNTILFRKDTDIFLMDKESFGQPRLTKIMRAQENTDVYFNEKTEKLYYIDDDSHFLSSVQILHHKPFIPKPIADTLRIKKLEE